MAFSTEEKMAVTGVLKILVESSGEINDAKLSVFDRVATSRGFGDFTQVFERMEREIPTREDLETLLDGIRSPESRERILRIAVEVVRSDGMMNDEETRILKNLARAWHVDLRELLLDG